MKFLIRVRVNPATIAEFGKKLQSGELDKSLIKGETYCLKNDPAVGYSIWEADTQDELENKFNPWRQYYSEVEISETITPIEAMGLIIQGIEK